MAAKGMVPPQVPGLGLSLQDASCPSPCAWFFMELQARRVEPLVCAAGFAYLSSTPSGRNPGHDRERSGDGQPAVPATGPFRLIA